MKLPFAISQVAAILLLVTTPVWAISDLESDTYSSQLDAYRNSYQAYQLKTTQYQATQTFASLEELVLATRALLIDRSNVWLTHFNNLRLEVLATQGMSDETEQEILIEIDSISFGLKSGLLRMGNIATKEQINAEALGVNSQEDSYANLTYSTLSQIIINRLAHVHDQQTQIAQEIKAQVELQIRDEVVKQSRLRGLDEVVGLLAVTQENINLANEELSSSRSGSTKAENRYNNFVELASPIRQQLRQVNKLLIELSQDLE